MKIGYECKIEKDIRTARETINIDIFAARKLKSCASANIGIIRYPKPSYMLFGRRR